MSQEPEFQVSDKVICILAVKPLRSVSFPSLVSGQMYVVRQVLKAANGEKGIKLAGIKGGEDDRTCFNTVFFRKLSDIQAENALKRKKGAA